MTSDPYDDDPGPGLSLRDLVAGVCRRLLGAARWLGLVQ